MSVGWGDREFMKTGVTISTVGHAAALLWGMLAFVASPYKSDPVEARAAARFALTERPTSDRPLSLEFRTLRKVAGRLQAAVRQRTRLINQLHHLTALTFPELALVVHDLAAGWWNVLQDLFFPLLIACWLASIASQALSYRRSSGERRQQLKWLLAGSAATLVALGLVALLGSVPWLSDVIGVIGFLALPVSIGVAVLKYRLFDIDRIISRTLAYAIVTGLLVGLYAGLVLLATQVLGVHSTVAVAAATLAAAALFNPVRRRVQLRVDRRFNRARYDADQMVAVFAARLKDTVDLDSVRDDLASVASQALEPAHVSVWISHRD